MIAGLEGGGPIAWPPKSPDLTQLDFSLWGRITTGLHAAWRGSDCPHCLGTTNHQAATWHFWAHSSVTAASLSDVHRGRWPCVRTPALNWYKITFSFRILRWFCLISSFRQTQFDGPQRCKDASPTCNCLTINICFEPPVILRILGIQLLRSLYKTSCVS